ncbi:Six-hairpin glycosidase-like protein [Aspergillus carlsbadensis]|nr:Six-hairpin glycosidase-like protein [Aspergillus carlsbadensis]
MPPPWTKTTPWLWTPDPSYTETDPNTPAQFVLFRKTFTLPNPDPNPDPSHNNPSPAKPIILHVSADTRYRLYVNGRSVSFGPAKSYLGEWNYETVDIAPFVKHGEEVNVLAARVLRYSASQVGNTGMVRAAIPGFFLYEDSGVGLSTSIPWLCKVDKSTRILPATEWNRALGPPFLCINEEVDAEREERGWLRADFDDSHWDSAVRSSITVPMLPVNEPWRLVPRSIPVLPEIRGRFMGVVGVAWKALIHTDTPLTIPANTTTSVILSSETLVTAFLHFSFRRGAASKIQIRCAECFEYPAADANPNPFARNKGDRTDSGGILLGPDDFYTLPSSPSALASPEGEEEEDITYSPFWHRTFRFLRLTITTKCTPLTLTQTTFSKTHYPLEITTTLPHPSLLPDLEARKWTTSLTTLLTCMQETYTDCPFYEQNQFALDTRLQALFSYNLSRDDRLARKALQEFAASRRACDGLVETHFPGPFAGTGTNIPVFSMFWVLMVHDHMLYFGDESLVRRYIGAVDGILEYFEARIESAYGMVGRFDEDAWAFVDWTREWSGIPPGGSFTDLAVPPGYRRCGVISYVSLVYAYVLGKAAEMCEFLCRRDVAGEYRGRAKRVNEAVLRHCLRRVHRADGEQAGEGEDDEEFLTDAPDSPEAELSQHTQIFAILSGAVTGARAAQILRRALSPTTNTPYAKCSYALSFYVFEAAIQTGLYAEFRNDLVQPWADMLRLNLSTWAESAAMPRSDCHGWSCVPIYDAVVNVLGVRPVAPGFARLRFEPRVGFWDGGLEGDGGGVRVSWEKEKKGVRLAMDFDAEVEVRDGKEYKVVKLGKGQVLTVDS